MVYGIWSCIIEHTATATQPHSHSHRHRHRQTRTVRGGLIGRARGSRAGDQKFGSLSSQTNEVKHIFGASGTGVRQESGEAEEARWRHQARLGPDHGSVSWLVQVSVMIV